MRVLVVSPIPTHPATEGNRVCVLSYVEALKDLGHEVDLLYTYRPWAEKARDLAATAAAWETHFYSHAASVFDRLRQSFEYRVFAPLFGGHSFRGLCPSGLGAKINSLCEQKQYDAIIFNYWFLVGAAAKVTNARTLLFTHDMFANRAKRTGSKWLSTDDVTEKRALEAVDAILAIQAAEGEAFAKQTATPVHICYSYFPVVPVALGPPHDLLFLAGPNAANVEAITWFARYVLPSLRSQDARIRLVIAGGVCKPLANTLLGDGVSLQPDVPHLASFYAQGAICVNPINKGTGLKIKLLEAMAFGRVVACHPHCLEGIYDPTRAPAIACATAGDYVREILKRTKSPGLLDAESDAAYQYVREVNARCCQSLSSALTG